MRKAAVIIPNTNTACQECGCQCNSCGKKSTFDLDLARRQEELHAQVRDKEARINRVEVALQEQRVASEQETSKLQEELDRLRDRHDRLYEGHKRLQKVNASLEENLLAVVRKSEELKLKMQQDVATLTSRLVEAKSTIAELERESEECREDCAVAVNLLQNKPSQYVSHKLKSLPIDLQERVRLVLPAEEPEQETDVPEEPQIHVPMQTFPPCAMVYSLNKEQERASSPSRRRAPDSVPHSVVSHVLSRKLGQRRARWTFVCTRCRSDFNTREQSSQTEFRERSNSEMET